MEPNQIKDADILDILFEGRNKDYGAYELRKTYNGRIKKAMTATGAVVGFPEAIVPIDSRYGWDLEGDLEFLTAPVAELVERYHPPDPKGGRRGACPAEG